MPKILLALYGTAQAPSSWVIGELVLPFGPAKMQMSKVTNKETIDQDGSNPINVTDGFTTTLTFSGSIRDLSKSDAQLWDDVFQPMLELIGLEVTLVTPIQGINGNWLLESFEPNRDTPSMYNYTMRLSKGSLNINVAAPEEYNMI